jgi:hypothetical protein
MPPSNNTMMKPSLQDKTRPPSGPEQALKGMIALIDELVLVMDKEIILIENRKIKEHAELLRRKQRLTVDYRASVKSISLQPDLLKQTPEGLRQKAKEASQKLSDASDRNAKILRGAITALQRLIQTIIAIVKDEVLPKGGYSNPNDAQTLLGTYSPTCKPVTVSRTA